MDVSLVLVKKNGSQKAFPLSGKAITIGRRSNCDLCIPIESVSKKHCQLVIDADKIKIHDLSSKNGTGLNGKRVKEATVKPGDYIKIGPIALVLQIDGQPEIIEAPQQPSPDDTVKDESIDDQFASFEEIDGEQAAAETDLLANDPGIFLDDSEFGINDIPNPPSDDTDSL